MTTTTHPDRRRAVITVAAAAIAGASCATRVPLAPLRSIAVLPVGNVDAHHLDNRDIETRVVTGGGPPPPGSFSTPSAIVIDQPVRQRFASGMAALNPAFHRSFEGALLGHLRAAGIAFTRADDEAAAKSARGQRGGVAALSGGADGVLDIVLDAAGFRPYGKEQVLTPEAYVEMDLVSAATRQSIDGAKYSFDRRAIGGDPRHLRCEPNQTYDSLAKLFADLPGAAKVLDAGFQHMAEVVARDVVQLVQGKALV
jgi:hypothetical protein